MSSKQISTEFTGKLAEPPWAYRMWMLAGSRERFFDKLVSEYGDFIRYRGVLNFFLVNHPSLVWQVLQETHTNFDKQSPLYDRFLRAFGAGLVVAERDSWKQRRAIAQKLMGPKTIRAYFDLMVASAASTLQTWQLQIRQRQPFDIAVAMENLTLEIVGRTLFHDEFGKASLAIRRWTKIIDHYTSKPPLPVIRSVWFPSRLNRRLRSTLGEFNAFIQSMIDRRRSSNLPPDLLSLLCAPADSDSHLNDEEIRDEVLGMIVGGHETSAVAMTWIWYELCQNPAAERRLWDEIDSVVGDRQIQFEDLPNLVYTRMIIDETLRLHPPFWFENRNAMNRVELGGETLPAGSMVVFNRYSLHRHPDFWNSPDEFNPERFRPGSEENARSSHAYVPFGGGPRVCVGIHFALQELTVLLVTIAQQVRLRIDESHRHKVSALLTLRPKHGLRVTATPR